MDLDPRRAGRRPARIGRRIAALLVTAACLALEPAHAQPTNNDGDDATVSQALPDPAAQAPSADAAGLIAIARSTVGWRWEASPNASIPTGPLESLRGELGAAPPIDYRLWFGDRRAEVGIGLASTSSVVLAFRHQVSAHSRLTVDTQVGGGRGDAPMARPRSAPFGVALESSPLHGLAKGTLLRTQLNLHSSLALRLRGGRLGLYLQVRMSGGE